MICMGVTRAVMKWNAEGRSPYEIRTALDHKYMQFIKDATPTPYPRKT